MVIKQNMSHIVARKMCLLNLKNHMQNKSTNSFLNIKFNQKKILIVDSDPHSCNYLKKILQNLKLNKRVDIDICHTGVQACTMIQHSIKWHQTNSQIKHSGHTHQSATSIRPQGRNQVKSDSKLSESNILGGGSFFGVSKPRENID